MGENDAAPLTRRKAINTSVVRPPAIETRSLPALARRYPRGFTFCVAPPGRSAEVNRRNGDVALSVSDTGAGIAAENLPRVFEPFYTGKPNGSGLGLTIAERIVGAHGGRIEIDSEVGRGTRVTLLFPVAA